MLDRATGFMLRGMDASDLYYAVDASWDYDPGPSLADIRAPLLAINFADDLINPPELGILETEIRRVPHGEAVVYPLSAETVGHGTHSKVVVWRDRFAAFFSKIR
jgi:homoserine O-acetyltransferase